MIHTAFLAADLSRSRIQSGGKIGIGVAPNGKRSVHVQKATADAMGIDQSTAARSGLASLRLYVASGLPSMLRGRFSPSTTRLDALSWFVVVI